MRRQTIGAAARGAEPSRQAPPDHPRTKPAVRVDQPTSARPKMVPLLGNRALPAPIGTASASVQRTTKAVVRPHWAAGPGGAPVVAPRQPPPPDAAVEVRPPATVRAQRREAPDGATSTVPRQGAPRAAEPIRRPTPDRSTSTENQVIEREEPDLDDLARRLLEPVGRMLRTELRHGRERAGRLHDRRR